MIQITTPSSRKRQLGLSLVELMIAMLIGLILLGAMSHILIGSRQASKTDTDVSRMQENGRYAMDTIGRAIRQAGYRLNVLEPLGKSTANPLGILVVDGTNGTNAPDTITLQHDPAWTSDATNKIKGKETNCIGGTVDSNNTSSTNTNLVVYIFKISAGKLRCAVTAGAAGEVVADNIEDMQIEYGIGSAGVITAHKTANNLSAAEKAQIAAVRVSLLIRSPTPNLATGTQTLRYNGADVTWTDGYLRQVYTLTFTVRNLAQ